MDLLEYNWRVESGYFVYEKSSSIEKLIEIMENLMINPENEKVYMKLIFNNYYCKSQCAYGIISNNPLYSCMRFSKLHRKRVPISFSDKNIQKRFPEVYKDPIIKSYLYTPQTENNILGVITYETKTNINILSCGELERKILERCI